MTTPPLPQDTGQTSQAPKKSNKGCIIAAAICAAVLVIGVIAVIGLGFWGYGKVKDRVATDPAKVMVMSNDIVELDMGADPRWEPQFGLDIFIMKMAAYGIDGGNAFMVIMNGDPQMMGTGEQFESQMRAEMEKQNAQRNKQMEATTEISSGREEFMVQGTAKSFLVAYSEGVDSKTRYIEVSGSLDSKEQGRTAFIYLKAPEATVSLEQAKALIESAK